LGDNLCATLSKDLEQQVAARDAEQKAQTPAQVEEWNKQQLIKRAAKKEVRKVESALADFAVGTNSFWNLSSEISIRFFKASTLSGLMPVILL